MCLRFLCLLHQLHAKQERNSPQRVRAILKLRFRMFLLQQPVISLLWCNCGIIGCCTALSVSSHMIFYSNDFLIFFFKDQIGSWTLAVKVKCLANLGTHGLVYCWETLKMVHKKLWVSTNNISLCGKGFLLTQYPRSLCLSFLNGISGNLFICFWTINSGILGFCDAATQSKDVAY